MKMSEKTLLKKIEQAFAENYCTGTYKLELEHYYDDCTYYELYYTYETGETIAVDITVTLLGEVKFYSPVHCHYISNFNNHTKSVINVLRMLFDMIDSNKDIMIKFNEIEPETEEATATSEDFISEGIAKECTTCPDFCEEDCIENAECSRGNDVFDGCKTVKDVMEVKQELNARFGKEQYFDTDSLQPNKTIIEKIENINHCPNQNTCCIVSPFVHCNYNYKSDSCIKAHKNFIHNCEQVHKQMKARSNPEWHHVNLKTLRNIDFDMLDEKRKVYLSFYKKWQETRKNLRRCSCGYSYDRCRNVFRRSLTIALDKKKISKALVVYFDRQISMVNVECGVWSSAVEVATGQHESRKYNKANLRY